MPAIYDPLEEPVSFPFDVSPVYQHHTPLFNDNFVPKYLYRLVVSNSRRRTSGGPGNTQDIFHLPPQKAAALLLKHLLWQTDHESGCTLMSWTSSLLFALQYALYRHRKHGDDLSQIQLIVLDTTLFPRGTFIQDMEIMRSFQDADWRLQKFVEFRESEYYFGEYLTQGRLAIHGRSVCTSVQKMIDLGLFELGPVLADRNHWQWWPKRVVEFREEFRSGGSTTTTDEDVQTAVDIAAQCFGGQWTVPGAIMLLALQPRNANDEVILECFKCRFTVEQVKQAGLDKVTVVSGRLPEVGQFKELVGSVQRAFSLADDDPLVDSLQALTVG